MADVPHVLVVDDEPADNQFLTAALRGLGHAVESALDGQAALEAIKARPPALVFLDMLLPKVDGLTVLKALREADPAVPVYMMSGVYKKKSYETEAVDHLRATGYLCKPLSLVQVWDLAERHLPGPQAPPADTPGVPSWRRPIVTVVGDLLCDRRTGILFLRSGAGAAALSFEDGQIVHGVCNDARLRLDRVLHAAGKITTAQLAEIAPAVAAARGGAGELLVQRGLVSAEDLNEARTLAQRNHVTWPLTWNPATSWFVPSEIPRSEPQKLRLDGPALVFWAGRHLEIDEHVLRSLPRPEARIRCQRDPRELVQPFGLSPDEVALIQLMDGTRSLAQVRAIGRMMQIDVERILLGLHSLRLLEAHVDPGAQDRPAARFGFAMPAAGDLDKFPAALLMVSAALGGKTGVLQLEKAAPDGSRSTCQIHFCDGSIAFATSDDPATRIGQVLLRSSMVTQEQLDAALALAASAPGLPLGRVLVGQGVLKPDDLHAGLVQQVLSVVTTLVGWNSGTFRYEETEGPPRDIVPLGLDARQALLSAMRACPFADLASKVPSREAHLRRVAAGHQIAEGLTLTDLEERACATADGSRSVREIAAGAPEGEEAALRAICAMITLGLIEGYVPAMRPAGQAVASLPHAGAAAPAVAAARAPDLATGSPPAAPARARAVIMDDESFGLEDTIVAGEGEFGAATDGGQPYATGETSFGGLEEALLTDNAWLAPRMPADSPPAACLIPGAEPEPLPLCEPLAAEPSAPGNLSFGDDLRELGSFSENLGLDSLWPGLASTGPTGGATVATPTLTEKQAAATCAFLAQLSRWLKTCPEAVPESVRAELPAEIRAMFEL